MRGTRWNWQILFSYGEVICFASAWLVALVMSLSAQRPTNDRATMPTFALSHEAGGLQARK
jgi:hypothetical protein